MANDKAFVKGKVGLSTQQFWLEYMNPFFVYQIWLWFQLF